MSIELGKFNRLEVVKEVDFGMYLDGGDEGEILLPARYVPEGCQIGDILNVFLYLDNEERLIATTLTPLVQVGEFACLEVAWVNQFGAFLNWGLMKDLFVPFSEQKMKMQVGRKYVVHAHLDEESYRIVASAKVERYLSKEKPEYAPGAVFWHDKGYKIYRKLIEYMRNRQEHNGYEEVSTPRIMDRCLWETSGHWEKYGAHNYSGQTEDGKWFCIKPMNCPGGLLVYKQGIKSYRDLPLRMAEFGKVNRYEASGALMGLMRVREFTQDDAHIFCTPEQMEEECITTMKLIFDIYKDFGFDKIKIYLSTRPEKRIGSDEIWDISEKSLASALEKHGYEYEINEGEGAFYGPKLEFILRDAIGREWQCGTIQVDMNLPQRFDISYIGEDGEKHQPVMLHRALFGSIERFLGILIEHHAGKLPLWLSPEQVVVMPVTSAFDNYAEEVAKTLRAAGLTAKTDLRNEKINYKIREHSVEKIPVIMVVGAKEEADKTVTIRRLGSEKQEIMPLAEAVAALAKEAEMPHKNEA